MTPRLADLPGGQEEYTDADRRLAAGGSLTLTAGGDGLTLAGQGDETAVTILSPVAISLFCGTAQLAVAAADEGASGSIGLAAGGEGTVLLTAGLPDLGSRLEAAPETLTLAVGPPGAGASITLTPESITLRVGEVTLVLTAEGIAEDVLEVTRAVTAEGHNFTAAEVELNVGVEGWAFEGPAKLDEVEAGTVDNETLGVEATDAVKNEDAAILLTE